VVRVRWAVCVVISLALACATATPEPASTTPRAPPPEPAKPAPAEAACTKLAVEPMPVPTPEIDAPIPPIESGAQGLARFYERLARLIRGKLDDHVRIALYGDSNMTRDYISGELRRVLQARHGDGGHGYVAIGKPWSWYEHMDVEHGLEPKAWRSFAVSTHAVIDDSYGFGGIAAQSISDGARAWVHTAKPGAPVGTRASRFDVYWLMQPKGGRFEVRADGESLAQIATSAPDFALGHRRFELEDAPHRVLFAANVGARLFGVVLERSEPGIVVDSLGVGGAKIGQLARMRDEIATAALAKRGYDLVMVLTGATEDDADSHDPALEKFIDRHRRALPESSCLVMSPPDFAYGSARSPRPSKRIGRLGRRKQRIALERGCAFWDFHAAMGGELSIARFAGRGLAWPDLAHLNDAGGALMARRFLHALWRDFAAYVAREPNAGCTLTR
jgi:hypothetical protein